MRKKYLEILSLLIGSAIFAIGINFFAIPNKLAEGGFTGITMITYYLFHWSPDIVYFILNASLLIIGYKFLKKQLIIYTIISILAISFFLRITDGFGVPTSETLLGTIFAGVFIGVGLGIVFRAGGTTGGSTVLAQMVHQYFGWSISKSLLVFDLIVVAGGYFVIGFEKTMYTIISIYIGIKVLDYIMEGLNPRKAINVISDKADEIAAIVSNDMNRGVTIFPAKGHYSGVSKETLYIIINKNELFELKKIIHAIDPNAFVVINDVNDVLGEGFTLPSM
ncbi:YitT family protein [Bacillus sp. EAC]|uniref:YitT family protein n=1 Tax=Bacillus sp. EAC TaxID=1978338 RepID=UPI000B4379CC|nr:YitT family protein [Bacillus sp. EAC]